jgi:1-acyl-sn-glycerol-3-phosphate acyltransferase
MASQLREVVAYELLRETLGHYLRRSFLHFDSIGAEHVPGHGPTLLVANHRSPLDPFLLAMGLRRHLHFVADSWLEHLPLVRWLGATGLVFLPQGMHRTGGLVGAAERRLRNGEAIAIFPEGMDSFQHGRLPRELGPFHGAFARLWWRVRDLGVPVVPCAILSTDRAEPLRIPVAWIRWIDPDNPAFRVPTLITPIYREACVHYGPPIPLPDAGSEAEAVRSLKRTAWEAVHDLLTHA